MSNSRKILFVLAAIGTAISLTGVALMWLFLPSSEWVKSNIEAKIAEVTSTEIVIGKISVGFSFSGPIKVVATDTKVSGQQLKEMLRVDKIEMTPSILGLLQGQISISSIYLDGVKASVIIGPDGSYEYPFVPIPIKVDKTRDNDKLSVTELPTDSKKSQDLKISQPDVTWSVDLLRATNVTLDLIDLRAGASLQKSLTVGLSDLDLKQAGSGDTFNCSMNGTVNAPPNSSAATFSGLGSVKLNPTLNGIERLNYTLNIVDAELAFISQYQPEYGAALESLSLSGVKANLEYAVSTGASVNISGSVGHNSNRSAPLIIKAQVNLSEDLTVVRNLELTGEASKTPLSIVTPWIEGFSINSDKGNFSGPCFFKYDYPGEWSTKASLQLENILLFPETGRMFNDPSISLVAWGSPEVLELKEFSAKNTAGFVRFSGKIRRPFDDSRDLDLNLESLIKLPTQDHTSLIGPNDLDIKGPIKVNGLIKGGLGKADFELHADMSQCSLDIFRKLAKQPGKNGLLWLKGVVSNSKAIKNGSVSVDAQCGAQFNGASIMSGQSKPAINDLNIVGKSKLHYGPQGLDLKDFDVEFKRNNSPSFLAKLRGTLAGLVKGPLKLVTTVNTNVDSQLISSIGLVDSGNLKIDGQTTLSAKINQSRNSYSFSIEAPLKNLDISYDKVFRKKTGGDGFISIAGAYSQNSTNISASSLSLPGLSLTAAGLINDRADSPTEIDLILKEADLKKLASCFPEMAKNGLSGRCSAKLKLRADKTNVIPTGVFQVESIQYKPEKSMIFFDSVSGSAKINGKNLDDINLNGRVRGFVDAPLRCSGHLQNIYGIDNLKGNVSTNIGSGTIRLQNFKGNLTKPQAVIGMIGAALFNNPNIASPEFSHITGDFRINRGVAETDNLLQVGGDLRSGMIGSIDLRNQEVNAVLGAKALINPPEQIGKIPAVKELVKKHEGLLKMTGLDKELKRFGIDSGDQKATGAEQSKSAKTPVVIIFRLSGNAGEPNVTPVLEKSLGEPLASRIKALID